MMRYLTSLLAGMKKFSIIFRIISFKLFSCPPYFYGDRCADFSTPDFTFTFEKSSVSNYVKFDGPQDNLTSLSFCSWIQTDDHFNYGSIISYANLFSDNAFTFTDYNGFVLYINGVNVFTDIKIIDNIWHFLCGKFKI